MGAEALAIESSRVARLSLYFSMPSSHSSSPTTSPGAALANDLVDQIESLLLSAESAERPLEIEPYRSRLFELFVMAEATGFLEEGAERDLTCDGVGRELASRWNLAASVGPGGVSQASSLPARHLSKLRLLWSFMRMWMEWTYAWKRWPEFHQPGTAIEQAGK